MRIGVRRREHFPVFPESIHDKGDQGKMSRTFAYPFSILVVAFRFLSVANLKWYVKFPGPIQSNTWIAVN
jgi:hypothetical protein